MANTPPMTLDQMRLRLHSAHTYALEVEMAATKRWGAKSALTVAMGEVKQRLTAALNVVDQLTRQGER